MTNERRSVYIPLQAKSQLHADPSYSVSIHGPGLRVLSRAETRCAREPSSYDRQKQGCAIAASFPVLVFSGEATINSTAASSTRRLVLYNPRAMCARSFFHPDQSRR